MAFTLIILLLYFIRPTDKIIISFELSLIYIPLQKWRPDGKRDLSGPIVIRTFFLIFMHRIRICSEDSRTSFGLYQNWNYAEWRWLLCYTLCTTKTVSDLKLDNCKRLNKDYIIVVFFTILLTLLSHTMANIIT